MSFIVLFPPEQAFNQVRWDAELIEDFRLLFNLSRFDKVVQLFFGQRKCHEVLFDRIFVQNEVYMRELFWIGPDARL